VTVRVVASESKLSRNGSLLESRSAQKARRVFYAAPKFAPLGPILIPKVGSEFFIS
jgi:hypothetical protein